MTKTVIIGKAIKIYGFWFVRCLCTSKTHEPTTGFNSYNEEVEQVKKPQSRIFGSQENKGQGKKDRPFVTSDQMNMTFEDPPTTCCMSGCPNCVWLDYLEKVVDTFGVMDMKVLEEEVEKRIDDANVRAFVLLELRSRKVMTK